MSKQEVPTAWESWRSIQKKDPKRLVKLIEAGIKLRNARRELEHQAEVIGSEEAALKKHLLLEYDKADLKEVKTSLGTGRLVYKDIPNTDPDTGGWEATYTYIVLGAISTFTKAHLQSKLAAALAKHIAQHGFWDLIQKRLGERACQDRWEAGVKIPGVKQFNKVEVKLGDAE